MAFRKRTIRDIDVSGKRVLMRVDFNVPLDEDCNITDDTRIRASLPSIRHCLDGGASLVLMSHLGRPKGKVKESLRLAPAAKRLGELLGREIHAPQDCVGPEIEVLCRGLGPGEVVLLENTRFHSEETKNDPDFAARLASLGEVYVNDAFGSSHRAHASTEGAAHHLSPAVAGFLMEKELRYLGDLLTDPKRPFVAILGGAKVSGKVAVVNSLLDKVDAILIGGAMAYTFIKAKGGRIGNSLLEEDQVDVARSAMEKAGEKGVRFLLPVDHVVVKEAKPGTEQNTAGQMEIPEGCCAVDIGPETVDLFTAEIRGAVTVFWNGPLGMFEIPDFAKGTFAVARAVAASQATTVIGGGDSVSAVHAAGVADQITHISTGGGASLEFVEGRELPGVEALDDLR